VTLAAVGGDWRIASAYGSIMRSGKRKGTLINVRVE
jgi:hypothetical protein